MAQLRGGSTVGGSIIVTAANIHLYFPELPIYANNAAAITGGLTVGMFYRTSVDPDYVCVVH